MSGFPQAENRATEAERTVSKLQKEVDRLEGRPGMTYGVIPLRIPLTLSMHPDFTMRHHYILERKFLFLDHTASFNVLNIKIY